MVESGIFYGTIIDPLLISMRKRLLNYVQKNDEVIDLACGTGAQVFELAGICKKVVGIDLSASMISYARKKLNKQKTDNAEFKIADATKLSEFADNSFTIATKTLALHQFNPELYSPLLNEMKRISKKIIIIDYHIPLPNNFYGLGCKTAEFFAGFEHNSNFKKYSRSGGLNKITEQNGIKIIHSEVFGKGIFQLAVCSF